ncbi:alkaline phosphatase D family protein [Niallia oryzisoli]|uniref:Alkaline phosphatase D family protein n=1 Tax=Niallia oryzisoli TaxID=1737571 RepID=A0ABZ2CHC2_9BACI
MNNNEHGIGSKISRRNFLGASSKAAVAVTIGMTIPFSIGEKEAAAAKFPSYPFTLGVASGDPLPESVVLWTRLAPDPLAADGLGGMTEEEVIVKWEVAVDEQFKTIVKRGHEVATPDYAYSIHAEVYGLEPGKEYYYRFKSGNDFSPVGKTKTAPAYGSQLDQLNFAFASCQNVPAGYYTAYDHMVKEDLDLVIFLGDYIYENGGQGTIGRGHVPAKEIFTLEDYRVRYGQYKSDPSLQAAHAVFPWIVTLDDHELENNFGGDATNYPNKYASKEEFLARREAAFQAYYEHMPLRRSALPSGIDMQVYRRFNFGNLAEFNVLDTRQYRTNTTSDRLDPNKTMMGEVQESWLYDGLSRSNAHWNILAQQVLMAQRDTKLGEGYEFATDNWNGYVANRDRLFNCITENDLNNVVVITGDSHRNWVNDLKEDFFNLDSRTLATEFVGTSISSGGDGKDMDQAGIDIMSENPHVKWMNNQRGYVRCQLTPEQLRADFMVVPHVTMPGAPISNRASFIVENGKPGAVRI